MSSVFGRALQKTKLIVSSYPTAEFSSLFARFLNAADMDDEYKKIMAEFEDRPGSSSINHRSQNSEQQDPVSASSSVTSDNANKQILTDDERVALEEACRLLNKVDLDSLAGSVVKLHRTDVASIVDIQRRSLKSAVTQTNEINDETAAEEASNPSNFVKRVLKDETSMLSGFYSDLLSYHLVISVSSSVSFCMHWGSSSSTALLFDLLNNDFVLIDSNNPEYKECLTVEPFRIIQSMGSVSRLHVIDCGLSRSFILAIVEEMETKKFFLSSFELCRAEKTVSVIDEHFLGVEEIVDCMLTYIIEDEKGCLYCVMFGRNEEAVSTTLFHVVKINIDECGIIQSEVLASSRAIKGHWHQPFIFDGSICFLTLADLKNKMVVAGLHNSDNNDCLQKISTFSHKWPLFGNFSAPFCRKDLVFYYVFNKNEYNFKDNIGEIWALDLKQSSWVLCYIVDIEVVVEWPFLSVSSAGTIALHGFCVCEEERRTQKAHVFFFDLTLHLRSAFTNGRLETSTVLNEDQKNTATQTDNIHHLTFVEQTKYWFTQSYPSWSDTFNAFPEQQVETICVPDALDVLSSRRHEAHQSIFSASSSEVDDKSKKEKQAYRRSISGQTGEDKFFEKFRQLKLGGILIISFNTEEFIMKMCREKVSDFDYKQWKEGMGHFECDAIFLHRQHGAFIIETKGCESGMINRRLSEATKQLDKRIRGMSDIYCKVTDSDTCPLKFHGIICIPNVEVSFNQRQIAHKILGKKEIEGANFRQFWLSGGPLTQNQLEQEEGQESNSEKLLSFVAALVGYRSAKFVSLPTNTLEIYRIIERQNFTRISKQNKPLSSLCEVVNYLPTMKAESIVLTKEQLAAVECSARNIIVSGPPGTGKTTIMLLRALAAAKQNKLGNVIFCSATAGEQQLLSLFQKFFSENRMTFKRNIFIVDDSYGALKRNAKNLEDDIFCDEMPVDANQLSLLTEKNTGWKFAASSAATGGTTIVLTGYMHPELIANDLTTALEEHFPGFHHIQLKTVIRGTISIINEWKRFLPEKFFIPGHNVKGAPVEEMTVNGLPQLLTTVEQKVFNLLKCEIAPDGDSSGNFRFAPNHLAILISWKCGGYKNYKAFTSLFKNHMAEKEYRCGTIAEQFGDSNLIGVGDPYDALAMDWPALIYVDFDHEQHEKWELIALSRCIAKLIIIRVSGVSPLHERLPTK